MTTQPSPRNPMPELAPVLKQLRLSGLLESLEQRNREAIEHKMTYPEFLALIIQDEAARRDQKKYGTRLRRAGFRGDKTLESFDFDFNRSLCDGGLSSRGRFSFCFVLRFRLRVLGSFNACDLYCPRDRRSDPRRRARQGHRAAAPHHPAL